MSDNGEICICSVWQEGDSTAARLCVPCHKYWRGNQRLSSVSKVLRSCWPIAMDFSKAKPADVENARIRGIQVDWLFTEYLSDRLTEIPVWVREDAAALFLKLKAWWDGRHDIAKPQVILADDRIAGTCDVYADEDTIYDLKCKSTVDPIYHIQLGAYAQLHFETFKRPVKKLAIIQVNKDLRKPKLIPVDIGEAMADWMKIRDVWTMANARVGKRAVVA